MAKREVQIELGSKLSPGAKRAMMRMKKGVKEIGALAKKALNFGTYMAAGAAGAATSLGLLISRTMDLGGSLDDMATRTGLSVEFLSKLSHAATAGGTSLAAVEASINAMSRRAEKASQGGGAFLEYFKTLSVEVNQSNGQMKSQETLFLEVTEALSKMEDKTKRNAVATRIFSNAGKALLPMLVGGKNGIKALMDESERLGNVWTSKTAQAAAEAGDAMDRVWAIVGNLRDTMAIELVPLVTEAADATRDWYLANKEVINSGILEFASTLKEGLSAAYDKIVEWSDSGEFIRWWDRVMVAATGAQAVLLKVYSGMAKIADLAVKISAYNPISLATDALGITDNSQAQTSTERFRMDAEAASAQADRVFITATARAAASGLRTDDYNRRGANSADAMSQAADAAVGAYQAGQEQRLMENAARLRMMGS